MECEKVNQLRELSEALIKFMGEVVTYLEAEDACGFMDDSENGRLQELAAELESKATVVFENGFVDPKCERTKNGDIH